MCAQRGMKNIIYNKINFSSILDYQKKFKKVNFCYKQQQRLILTDIILRKG